MTKLGPLKIANKDVGPVGEAAVMGPTGAVSLPDNGNREPQTHNTVVTPSRDHKYAIATTATRTEGIPIPETNISAADSQIAAGDVILSDVVS